MMFRIRMFSAMVLALTISTGSATAASLYVATNGSDSNNGTLSRPFKSISRAASVARPGDVVHVRAGTYSGKVVITKSGTRTAPIVFRPYQSEKPVVDGKGMPSGTSLVQISGNFVQFRGFTVRNSAKTGISVWGGNNVTIENNTITGSRRGGIFVGYGNPGVAHSNVIKNNVIHGNCLENSSRSWSSGWPAAISVTLSDRSTVSGNRVYKNFGEGIGALSSVGTKILDNRVYDNFSVLIYLDNSPSAHVTKNTVYHTNNTQFYRSGRPARGIQVANEYTSYPYASKNINITYNVLAGVGNVTYGNYQAGGGLINSVINPNTIYSSYTGM